MKHKVIALDTYKRLSVVDIEHGTVLEPGFEFEVDDNRLSVLLGNNDYETAFVKEVEHKRRTRKKSEDDGIVG